MNRTAGILLPVTSLPSPYGIGCFSREAYDFIDFLGEAGQTFWQILPLGPTGFGDSPYRGYSAFAGNPYLIDLEQLIKEKLLTKEECDAANLTDQNKKVDYGKQHNGRLPLLRLAFDRSKAEDDAEYQAFITKEAWWLDDYALFMALKTFFKGTEWSKWPQDIRMHWSFALDYYREKLKEEISYYKYVQFLFYSQWAKLKKYANKHHIRIIGDIPFYVAPDSADVWSHPDLFELDEENVPTCVSGCPPDGFSPEGQIWSNPLYDWKRHKETGYDWWISRMAHCFELYDVVRIDHFRGFDEYFSIPANAPAKEGSWKKGPGMDLFTKMKERLGEKEIIAEDLGYLTDSLRRLVKDTGFAGMKILQYAFDKNDIGAVNDYLPHNYPINCAAYTGTHDNQTLAGWYASVDDETKACIRRYFQNQDTPEEKMIYSLLCYCLMSCAKICIIPIQDYLELGDEARINQPSSKGGSWNWRLDGKLLTEELKTKMRETTMRYGRMNWKPIEDLRAIKATGD